MVGNGFDFWKTIPIRRRTTAGSTFRPIKIFAMKKNLTFDAGLRDELVHSVEATEKRRLTAAARTDDRGDRLARDARS